MQIFSSDRQITINTSSVVISEPKANAERVNITFVNVSTGGQVITISTSGDSTAGAGLVIYPGGSIEKQKTSNLPIIQNRITGIASGAGALLAVHEEVLQ